MSAITGDLSLELTPADARRHDLDALRAFAMLLGIALHAALSFIDYPWLVQDQSRAPALALVISAIHGFRMPVFFLLSGFFTAMLWRSRGTGGLLRHRAKRIVLPLTLACVTILPAMWGVASLTGSASMSYGAVDTGTDIWTAAAYGDLDAVRGHVARGVSLDTPEPVYGQSPLGWAVIGNQLEVIDYLLEAGANPSARYGDQNTALHTAAFFGRAEAAARLVDAGADVNARNVQGETPIDSMRHDQATTEYIAGLLKVPIDFDAVVAGRNSLRPMFERHGALSGLENPFAASEGEEGGGRASLADTLSSLLGPLMYGEFFMHLWFLWFLCWLVAGFVVVATVFGRLLRVKVPAALIRTPLCLVWLAPLTMLAQSFMSSGGAVAGFGADTSSGLIPVPHVLAYYAIFFGFGGLLYGSAGAAVRLGRGWWIQLPVALAVLPVTMALAFHSPWGLEFAGDEAARRLLANVGQVLYAWLMVFGLMGLAEWALNRERSWVRYVSDSSYWLYLVHLPLIVVGQYLLRGVNLPAIVKLTLLVGVTTAILLASYEFLVRYTWIGRLLNGPRTRRKAEEAVPAT